MKNTRYKFSKNGSYSKDSACQNFNVSIESLPFSFQLSQEGQTITLVFNLTASNVVALELTMNLSESLIDPVVSIDLFDSWCFYSESSTSEVFLFPELNQLMIKIDRNDCEGQTGEGTIAVVKIVSPALENAETSMVSNLAGIIVMVDDISG